jgi:CheY-like chemotaxis protein
MLLVDGDRVVRVLVVDDDAQTAQLWAHVLGRRGFEVRATTHPSSALAIAATFRPDVAVLDLNLPAMHGHDLGERLTRICEALRLIAVTGDDSDAARERSAARGFSVHLVKPIEIAALTRFVRLLASELALV